MPSINARNLSDELHERIARSAARSERSLEAEVRYALGVAYPDETGLSLHDKWLKGTAERLRHLHQQLRDDGFWRDRGPGTLTHLARMLGENTPARLLEWMDGTAALTFEAVTRIAAFTGCSPDWLIDDSGEMFPVQDISEYENFFLPEAPGDYVYHLIRYGRGDGLVPLHVIRHDRSTGTMVSGQMMGHFYLGTGMGYRGRRKLKEFVQFLKQNHWRLKLHCYNFDASDDESGSHHSAYFLHSKNLQAAYWLDNMFHGSTPPVWGSELRAEVVEIGQTPFGEPSDSHKAQ